MVAYLLFCLAAALYFGVRAVYFTHMLQLNSYRGERYRRWALSHWRDFLPPRGSGHLLPLLLLPTLLLPERVRLPMGAAMLVLFVLFSLPKKAKKPLVVTWRVKRLFLTQALLCLALFVGLYFASDTLRIGITAVYLLLPGGVVWLANAINAPLEKGIANSFVRDAKKILAAMPQLTVIGITGSYGKTSTKTFLQALLSVKYNVLMTPESYNTTMGVVRTIREQLRPTHQIFIAEMGARQVGDIKEICDLVHPTYGIITAIGEQHLETFGSLDNILRTKLELAHALPAHGKAFLNMDNPHLREQAPHLQVPVVGYGLTAGDYRATDLKVDRTGSSFTVTAPDGTCCRYTTKLLGRHVVQNLVGCIAVCHQLGIPLEDLSYPIRMLKPVPHRLQLLPNGIIDDAYNSNPAGFKAALDVLKEFEGQRILVTPGMVELGERQEALNRELGQYAAGCCDYAVLVGERQAPPLKAGLLAGGFSESQIYVAKTLEEGLSHIQNLPKEPATPRTVLLENDLPDNYE